MAMNIRKVVVGGLVAGIIVNAIDFIAQYALSARMRAESEAFKPGLADQMMQGSSIISYVIMDLVIGIALIWTYAAVRPRFGPGPRTAFYTALLFWLLGLIFNSGYRQMGMVSSGLWWTLAVIALINYVVASVAGAAIYSEDTVTT